jgi:hypothetical protein
VQQKNVRSSAVATFLKHEKTPPRMAKRANWRARAVRVELYPGRSTSPTALGQSQRHFLLLLTVATQRRILVGPPVWSQLSLLFHLYQKNTKWKGLRVDSPIALDLSG